MAADAFNWMRDLPAAFRFVRQARRMTLRDAARETGLSAATLNRIERGDSSAEDINFGTAISLANWIAFYERALSTPGATDADY